jgi:hypothetical protein
MTILRPVGDLACPAVSFLSKSRETAIISFTVAGFTAADTGKFSCFARLPVKRERRDRG